jgi:small subunit ribosomal protein S4
MSRYIGPVCRQCRREGIKLLLKGTRCETAKCPMEKQWRSNPPGMHAFRRSKGSNFGVRLREKQKVKRYYGLLERQFMLYFRMAERSKDNTGTALLALLERRLDNVLWKSNLAPSRKAGRVMCTQGHVYVNGRKVNRPGFLVSQGDKVSVKPSDKSRKMAKNHLALVEGRQIQPWLTLDTDNLEVSVVTLPSRDDVQIPVEEQLIVEMCSR